MSESTSSVIEYDRETMLLLSQTELSSTRPDLLSREFNNEAKLWCPDLWLESMWRKEGVESRGAMMRRSKQMDRLKAENPCLEGATGQVVLSPQRRSFGTGCRRALSPKENQDGSSVTSDGHWNRNQGQDGRGDWRSGNDKRHEKNYPYNWRDRNSDSSRDYGSGSRSWRDGSSRRGGTSGDRFQPSYRRQDNRNSYHRRQEQVPEWMDEGPESMMDTIELRGFDETDFCKDEGDDYTQKAEIKDKTSNKEKHQRQNNGSVRGRKSSSNGSSKPSSRPSSRNIPPATKPTEEKTQNDAPVNQPAPPLLSEFDFAALLGLSSTDPSSMNDLLFPISNGPSAQTSSTEGSRFSKFFTSEPKEKQPAVSKADTNNNRSKKHRQQDGPTVPEQIEESPTILRQLFGRGRSETSQTSLSSQTNQMPLPGKAINVEELEKQMINQNLSTNTPTTNVQREHVNERSKPNMPDPSMLAGPDEEHRLLMQSLNNAPLQPTTGDRRQMIHAQAAKGNPLQDPHQQQYLFDRLRLQQQTQTRDHKTPSPMNVQNRPQQPMVTASQAIMAQMMALSVASNRMPVHPGAAAAMFPGLIPNRGAPPRPGFQMCPPIAPADVRQQQLMLMQLMHQQMQQQNMSEKRVSPPLVPAGSHPDKHSGAPSPNNAQQSNAQQAHHGTTLNPAAAAFTPTSVLKQMAGKPNPMDQQQSIEHSKEQTGRPIVKQHLSQPNVENGRGISPPSILNQRLPMSQDHLIRAQQQQQQFAAAAHLLNARMPHTTAPMTAAQMPFTPSVPTAQSNQMLIIRAQQMAQLNAALQAAYVRGDSNAGQAIRQRMGLLQQVISAGPLRPRVPSPPLGVHDSYMQQQHHHHSPGETTARPNVLQKLLASVVENASVNTPTLPPDAKAISVEELEKKISYSHATGHR